MLLKTHCCLLSPSRTIIAFHWSIILITMKTFVDTRVAVCFFFFKKKAIKNSNHFKKWGQYCACRGQYCLFLKIRRPPAMTRKTNTFSSSNLFSYNNYYVIHNNRNQNQRGVKRIFSSLHTKNTNQSNIIANNRCLFALIAPSLYQSNYIIIDDSFIGHRRLSNTNL